MLRVTPLYGSWSHHPSSPIISPSPISCIVEYASLRVLVDVGLDETTSGMYRDVSPEGEIDCILISNSTLSSIGGLPLLHRRGGEGVPMYATFPTVKMGQMTLYDTHANASLDGYDLGWNLEDVDEVCSRVETLKYSQSIVLSKRGKAVLSITPHPAGHVVGACFWVLKRLVDETEVVICTMYHHAKEKVLAPMLPELLKFGVSADLLITRPGGPNGVLSSLYNPSKGRKSVLQSMTVARAEAELIESVMNVLRRGGNVLLPVDASGRVLELLLVLNRHWEKHRLSTAYSLCWVGSMSTNTIEYARSQLEWMDGALGQQFDSQRGHPFALKSVQILSSITQLDQIDQQTKGLPMAVLASGSTLDSGPARDLFLKWADNPDNAVILTDYQRAAVPRYPRSPSEEVLVDPEQSDAAGTAKSHLEANLFSTSAQLLLKWCQAKKQRKEMADLITVDVLVPHRSPLGGKELQDFLSQEERIQQKKRAEEEKLAMLHEVELAKGMLRLGEDDKALGEEVEQSQGVNVVADVTSAPVADVPSSGKMDVGPAKKKQKKKRSRFDSNLFLKFSKPVYMTFEVREEAVGITQSDSVAKYGVGESVGRQGEILEDDYGIAIHKERFLDIVTGIDPSKHHHHLGASQGVGLGFGADGRPVLSAGAGSVPAAKKNVVGGGVDAVATGASDMELSQAEEQALEAADLSEGKGIIRGRNGRPHVKVTTIVRSIEVLAEIFYIPLEGKVDARAARQTVRALQPRQAIILGGAAPSPAVKQHLDALKKSVTMTLYDEDDLEELEMFGDDDEEEEEEQHGGEAALLADAVRELTLGPSKTDTNKENDRSFLPADNETLQLDVGHAAYSVRLIDTPYYTPEEKEEAQRNDEELPASASEPLEAKMGECTVSLIDLVATGQKVAADGSIVLAPKGQLGSEQQHLFHRPTVMISDGDVLLTDLRSEIIAQGMKAEYSAHSGYQQLLVNHKIILKKEQTTGKINVEGPLCEDFFAVRSIVFSQYVTL